jgi:branched-chain amino acid transport system permease protein
MTGLKLVAAIVAAAVAGFFLPSLAGGGTQIYSAFVLIAIFAVMSYGLDVIVADLGEVSLAHTVFFASGAYVTALLSTETSAGPLVTLLGSIAIGLAMAGILGLLTLRLRHFVFSLVTYAVAVVALNIAENWSVLGASDGLRGIPAFELFGYKAVTDAQLWPIAYLLLLVTLYVVYAFRRSKLGLAAMMVQFNPPLATISGHNPQIVRLQVFLLSAPISAVAGWLYAYQRAYVSADIMGIYFLVLMLTAVVVVGRRFLLGPLIGVALVVLQENFLSFGGYVDSIVIGLVLIGVLTMMPGGLVGFVERLLVRIRSRSGETT